MREMDSAAFTILLLSEAKHTATPWEFSFYEGFDGTPIRAPEDVARVVSESALRSGGSELWGVSVERDGETLTICYTGNGPTSKENAAFIVRACNDHADLLEAAKVMLDLLDALKLAEDHFASSENCGVCHPVGDCPTLRVIQAAIAKAEGRS